ncbi:hypothetical protein SOVF_097250 [Spinacia oleracea]|nr:hypothetical protein SOVF_097250 [Spinacia oleracea]
MSSLVLNDGWMIIVDHANIKQINLQIVDNEAGWGSDFPRYFN